MRKIKITIVTILAVILCCSAFAACSNFEGSDKDKGEKIFTLNAFESIEDMRMVGVSARFGKIERNTDTLYVSQGSASIAVYPYGDFEDKINPTLMISTLSQKFPTMDFSTCKYVSVDIYNSTDKAVAMKIKALCESTGGEVFTLPENKYTLPAKAWSKISYSFGGGSMKLGYNLDNLTRFDFEFPDSRQDSALYEPALLYFDNFVACEGGETYNPQRSVDEILCFEHLGDVNLLTRPTNASLSINGNIMFVASGSKSLMIEKTGTSNAIIKLFARAIDFSKLDGAKSISIDFFNASKAVGNFTFSIVHLSTDLKETVFSQSRLIRPMAWDTITITSDMITGRNLKDFARLDITVPVEKAFIDNIKLSR